MNLRETVETIIDELELAHEFFTEEFDYDNPPEAFVEANISIEFVDSYGGEGQGDSFWTVYKFTRGDESAYLQFDGWYASYEGSDFDEYFWVTPKEVTVVQFFPEE